MRGSSRIIFGISNIDSQMKQQEQAEKTRKERNILSKVIALAEDYLILFSVDPESGKYIVYSASNELESLGIAMEGNDFYGGADAKKVIHPEDLPGFLKEFSKENVLAAIRNTGHFTLVYRILVRNRETKVVLKIVPFRDGEDPAEHTKTKRGKVEYGFPTAQESS